MQPASVYAETTIIPSATLTGRYDSNIFNRPAQLLAPGTQLGDYRTAVGGAVELLHDTRDIEARLGARGTFNHYVEHTNRNYFSLNVQGSVGLDRWVDQYVRGASLRVTESFRYTPEPPGFVTGIREMFVEEDGVLHGVQGFRATQIVNATKIEGKYPVSRDLSLEGDYMFRYRHVGRLQGGEIAGIAFFNQMVHTWSGGARYDLTRNDSVAALYRQSFFTSTRSTGGRTLGSNLITLAGDYTKVFPEWRFSVEGGVTLAEPGGRTFPSGTVRVSTKPERDTVVSLILSRQGRPMFFLQGGAMISNIGSVGISHRVYERLTIDGRVAYAYNQVLPDTGFTYKNFSVSPKLSYKLTRTMTADLLYIFSNIDVDRPELAYQVSRHQVGFMLSIALDPVEASVSD